MGRIFRKAAKAAAGHVLIVIGLGIFRGVYRLKQVPQKATSSARRERRAAMRKALAEAAGDPEYAAAMEAELKVWDAAAGDGLAGR